VLQLLQEITKRSNLTEKIDLFNNIYNDLRHIFQNIHLYAIIMFNRNSLVLWNKSISNALQVQTIDDWIFKELFQFYEWKDRAKSGQIKSKTLI